MSTHCLCVPPWDEPQLHFNLRLDVKNTGDFMLVTGYQTDGTDLEKMENTSLVDMSLRDICFSLFKTTKSEIGDEYDWVASTDETF